MSARRESRERASRLCFQDSSSLLWSLHRQQSSVTAVKRGGLATVVVALVVKEGAGSVGESPTNTMTLPMESLGILGGALFVLAGWLVRHFVAPGTSLLIQLLATISFALGFGGIALLPIDLSITQV